MSTSTVTPTISLKDKETLAEVKVSVIKEKEIAAVLYLETDKLMDLAFTLQDAYESKPEHRKDALQAAAVMFLKAECSRAIAKWDNLVTAASKTPRYASANREEIAKSLKDNLKAKPFWTIAQKAIEIKKQL